MVFIEEEQEESMEIPEENVGGENEGSDEHPVFPEVEMPEEDMEIPEDMTDGQGENEQSEEDLQQPETLEKPEFTWNRWGDRRRRSAR